MYSVAATTEANHTVCVWVFTLNPGCAAAYFSVRGKALSLLT
jgi:hypothetical protein